MSNTQVTSIAGLLRLLQTMGILPRVCCADPHVWPAVGWSCDKFAVLLYRLLGVLT
jgi:hypothetical protein